MRYDDLRCIAIEIMKLSDGQVTHIEESNQKTQRRNYEILKLWRDQHGGKAEDLCRIFHGAREQGIGVPNVAIDCLQVSTSQGILHLIF